MSAITGSEVPASPVYATRADWRTWTGDDAPDNAEQLILHASLLVRRDTSGDYYEINTTTGLPTSTVLATAMQRATIVHAAAMSAASIDPLAIPEPDVQSATQGGRTVTYRTSPSNPRGDNRHPPGSTLALLDTLVYSAMLVLQQSGLATAVVEAW